MYKRQSRVRQSAKAANWTAYLTILVREREMGKVNVVIWRPPSARVGMMGIAENPTFKLTAFSI